MAEKRDLARAGTIEMTSKEGKAFLEKNLTEWKKPMLMDQFAEDSDEGESSAKATKRGRGAKKRVTHAEAEEESSSPKKARLSKAMTMTATAKEGAQLIGDEKLGDTRLMTKIKQKKPAKAAPKRASTMVRTVQEAKAYASPTKESKGRSCKQVAPAPTAAAKRPAKKSKKAKLKKAGTMAVTAKAGKAFLKKSPPKGGRRTK